jgi:ABC-type uncharacterized transport system substrate-binding protein
MKRRKFIRLLGGAAVWPLAARAQQPAMPVIGLLDSRSPDALTDRLRGFRQGLKDTGYVEGENVAIEYRWAENQLDRLPALAAELVRRRVAVIATSGGPAVAFAAKAATTTIPMIMGNDAYLGSRARQIAFFALRHGLPTIGNARDHVSAGMLMNYGTNQVDQYRQAGVYVGRILKGDKPADLPVMQPTKFEFVINLKTVLPKVKIEIVLGDDMVDGFPGMPEPRPAGRPCVEDPRSVS